MRPLSNFAARDVEALLHPTTNLLAHRSLGPLVLERGEGVYVYDTAGKRYIEGLAGLWCTGLGYGNAELVEAAREQMERLSFSHLFGGRSHEPAIALAEKIKAMSPAPTSKVFFTNSGSEANDTQIKIAWYYNNAMRAPEEEEDHLAPARLPRHHHRRRPACRASRCSTPTSTCRWRASCTPTARTTASMPSPARPRRSTRAGWRATSRTMIEHEGPETIAAFIAEPVMGAGGVLIPPKTYFEKVQAVLAKHDIAFIADEVICGFARTGNWWGSQTFGIAAHHRHHGQGHHLGLRAAWARSPCRSPSTRGWWRRAASRACSRTASPTPAIRSPAPWRSRPSRSTSASKSSSTCSAWRRSSSCG